MERLPLPQLRGNIEMSPKKSARGVSSGLGIIGCRAKVGRVWDLGFKVLVGPPKQVECR